MLLFTDCAPGHPHILWNLRCGGGTEHLGCFAVAVLAIYGWVRVQPTASQFSPSLRWFGSSSVSPDFPPSFGQEAWLLEGSPAGLSDQQHLLQPLPGLQALC